MSTQYQHYPCNPDWFELYPLNKGRGVTTWNENNNTTYGTLAPNGNGSITVTFTCTVPKCYSADNTKQGCGNTNVFGEDSCNVVFDAYTTQDTDGTPQLQYILNGNTIANPGCSLSGKAQRGGTQAWELVNTGCADPYHDMGINTFVLRNIGPTSIKINDFRINRTYKLCNYLACTGGSCPFYYEEAIKCHGGSIAGTSGNLDYTRVDKSCNCAACGGLGHTNVHDTTNHAHTIPSGGSLGWDFTFSTLGDYGTYVGKSICLFNFNGISPCSDDTNNDDIRLVAYLNGTSIATYYLNKHQDKTLSPSYDLAKIPGTIYNDIGYNTMTLVNYGAVDVKMAEDIDIYRIYQTEPVDNCTTCGNGCQVSCQQCNTSCDVCQDACEWSCQNCQTGCEVTCQGCDVCYTCQAACQFFCVTCDTCQTACELSCQDCQETCQVTCQDCQTGCEVNCQTGCQVTCQTGCEICQSCYEDCYEVCYQGCYGG